MKMESVESDKGWLQRMARGLKNTLPFFKSTSSDDGKAVQVVHPLSHSVGQERALWFYLTPREHMLADLELAKITFSKATNNIFHVYDQLYIQKVCLDDSQSAPWKADTLPKVELSAHCRHMHLNVTLTFYVGTEGMVDEFGQEA